MPNLSGIRFSAAPTDDPSGKEVLSKRRVPLGAYWYSCANTPLEGIAEAKELLRLVKGKSFLYPLVMDVEDQHHQAPTSKQVLTDTVIAFCQTIEKAGYYAMIYSSTWWLHNELDLARLAPYDIWAAQWSVSEPAIRHGVWQYTSDGKVNGYTGRLDCNYAYKDYPKIIRENGLNRLGEKKPVKVEKKKSVEELAKEVIAGKWGNGNERKEKLQANGYDYDAVQDRVNQILSKKTIDKIAEEVIRGDWGNGQERKNRLTEAGYDYDKVQKRVNELI